jgi:integrase
MAVYRNKYKDKFKDPKTGKWKADPEAGEPKAAAIWWYEFTIAGRRIRESSGTSRKTLAVEAEKRRRLELEKALSGMPAEARENRIADVSGMVDDYQAHYAVNHRPNAVIWSVNCLKHIKRVLGTRLLVDLNENAIVNYMGARQKQGASGRTINMELGELSRVIGHPWRYLWPKVKKLDERKDVGRAWSPDEERALLDAAVASKSVLMPVLIRLALMTGLRAGEMTGLRWLQIDFLNRHITVGEAKTAAGTGRVIPMNSDLLNVLTMHQDWYRARFGDTRPDYYVFPYGSPMPSNPEKPTTELKTAWLHYSGSGKGRHSLARSQAHGLHEDGPGRCSRGDDEGHHGSHERVDDCAVLSHPHGSETGGDGLVVSVETAEG